MLLISCIYLSDENELISFSKGYEACKCFFIDVCLLLLPEFTAYIMYADVCIVRISLLHG